MYLKLALRNAKRSITDYLLYISTMILLLSVMFVSSYISLVGDIYAGFQTISLPLLILFILVILVSYINNFMLKQRAKEFSNYILMGMEKPVLVQMFLLEFFLIGIICLIISTLISFGICFIFSNLALQLFNITEFGFNLFLRSLLRTLFYFGIIEVISMCFIKKRLYKLEIRELMIEQNRSQNIGNKQQYQSWSFWLIANMASLLIMLSGIAFCPEYIVTAIVSIIAFPILGTIFTFYKWLFQYIAIKRQKLSLNLYQKERLYLAAKITSESKTNATINGVFCTCLLFSFMSYIMGTFLFESEIIFGDKISQKWMGYLQINLCLIFIVIYFSILSLKHMIEIQQQMKEMKILHYMGKNQSQIKSLMNKQIIIKLSLPALLCYFIMAISTPFVNYKLNIVLSESMKNIWLKLAGNFSACFLILYLCYYVIITIMSRKYIKT